MMLLVLYNLLLLYCDIVRTPKDLFLYRYNVTLKNNVSYEDIFINVKISAISDSDNV